MAVQFTQEQINAYANAHNIPASEALISLQSMSPQSASTAVGSVLGTSNTYNGTINGVESTVGQGGLQTLDPGSVTVASVDGGLYSMPTTAPTNAGGLGNFGTYNGVGVSKDAFNVIKDTDHGGTLTQNESQGLGVMDYANLATGLGGLAANVYYADKNMKLQEDAQNYARSRDVASDARKSKFAANVGGSY